MFRDDVGKELHREALNQPQHIETGTVVTVVVTVEYPGKAQARPFGLCHFVSVPGERKLQGIALASASLCGVTLKKLPKKTYVLLQLL